MANKNIKFRDVAHFYVGCKIKTAEGIGTFHEFALEGKTPIDSYDLVKAHLSFKEVKPILRPLNSISLKEIGNLKWDPALFDFETCKYNEFTPQEFLFLIKKHFDLFGLIKSGQAIDATTLTK